MIGFPWPAVSNNPEQKQVKQNPCPPGPFDTRQVEIISPGQQKARSRQGEGVNEILQLDPKTSADRDSCSLALMNPARSPPGKIQPWWVRASPNTREVDLLV